MKQYTPQDLLALPYEPYSWIAKDLLRTNRKRPSLLVGSPESGKSTLARQLSIAVARGAPFLGRETTKGKVLYWQSEEDPSDAREDFVRTGMTETDPIIILHSEDNEDHCLELNKALCQHPDTKLVIIETLDDFLKTDDLLNNNENRAAFARLDAEVISKHRAHCCFVILHWLKKSDTQHAQHGLSLHKILGGTCISGKTDAKIFLRQVSDEDPRRVIHANVRKGLPIEPTYLNFDPQTNTSELGMTVAAEKAANKTWKKDLEAIDLDRRIVDIIHENPGRSKWDIAKLVGGNGEAVGRRIDERIASGEVTVINGGKKKNAKLLYLTGEEPVTQERREETVCQ